MRPPYRVSSNPPCTSVSTASHPPRATDKGGILLSHGSFEAPHVGMWRLPLSKPWQKFSGPLGQGPGRFGVPEVCSGLCEVGSGGFELLPHAVSRAPFAVSSFKCQDGHSKGPLPECPVRPHTQSLVKISLPRRLQEASPEVPHRGAGGPPAQEGNGGPGSGALGSFNAPHPPPLQSAGRRQWLREGPGLLGHPSSHP